ncbi:hypothetical protein D3C87_1799990 [compost metagenome]
MHLGQAEVQDEQVELVVGHQRRIGLAAAGDVVHHGPRGAQGAQQAIGQHLVVFGNEDAHGGSLLVVGNGLGACRTWNSSAAN